MIERWLGIQALEMIMSDNNLDANYIWHRFRWNDGIRQKILGFERSKLGRRIWKALVSFPTLQLVLVHASIIEQWHACDFENEW